MIRSLRSSAARKAACLGLVAIVLSGCATTFAPRPQAVPVRSDPVGAEVSVDGVVAGTTPITLELDASRSYRVTLTLEGEERTIVLESAVDGTYLALDLLPGAALAGASLAFASSCSEANQCIVFSALGSAGVTVGLGAAAAATATDALTGSWSRLSPDVVVVTFD